MPIVLTDRRTTKTLTFGDATITLYEAAGDRVLAEIRRGARDAMGRPSEVDSVSLAGTLRLLAEIVTDWTGVQDATGAPVPWPEPGAALGPSGTSAPSPAALALRRDLLAVLPWNVISELDAAAARGWREGQDSGKGSPTASGG